MNGGTTVSTPKSTNETVFFCSPKVARTSAFLDGKEVTAVLYSGASAPVVREGLVPKGKIFQGKKIQVFDWKNESTAADRWVSVKLKLAHCERQVACLCWKEAPYDILVARPLMRDMRLNLHYDDRITFGDEKKNQSKETVATLMQSVDDIAKDFPKLVCDSEYPPTVKFFQVPFTLMNNTPVRRKPYALSLVQSRISSDKDWKI